MGNLLINNSSAEIAGKDLQEKINYNQISEYVPNNINRYVGRNLINFEMYLINIRLFFMNLL